MVKNLLRPLSRPLNLQEGDDILAALKEAATSSPRAAAIVATSLVEDALRWCLCGWLIPNVNEAQVFDNETSPLRTFNAKIIMGYSLGIYGEITRDDLHIMRYIRNAFAHSPRAITFDTPNVTTLCLRLAYLDHAEAVHSATTHSPISSVTDPRHKLLQTARLLIIDLYAIGSRDPPDIERFTGGMAGAVRGVVGIEGGVVSGC